jgi:C-5 cytosine-specific DNA methylase
MTHAGTLYALSTPQATNAARSSAGYGPNLHEIATSADLTAFGPYAEAIARWETITGREAPPPSTASRRPGGNPQLSARFVEWLMGLPDGHVTGADLALPREQQLRLLGNGVVPQQATLAVRTLTEAALRFGATS